MPFACREAPVRGAFCQENEQTTFDEGERSLQGGNANSVSGHGEHSIDGTMTMTERAAHRKHATQNYFPNFLRIPLCFAPPARELLCPQ